MSQCVPLWVYPAWDSLHFLNLVNYFFFHVREVFSFISSKSFLSLFSLSPPSGTLIMWMLEHFVLSLGTFRLSSLFSLYSILQYWFTPFCLPGHLSTPLPQLFCCWFLLVYYPSVCLFITSFRFLVNISWILAILFLRSWVISNIISLNSFLGRLPTSTSFNCFSRVLSCFFLLGDYPLLFHFH